jgi:RNA polymerase sigma-70 factor, ECF subfamily
MFVNRHLPRSEAVSGAQTVDELYPALRPLLFSIAYRMLGTVSEAEDVVQETFLRYHRATQDGVTIETPKAYLATIATRLSLDTLRSARRQRESYVGMWLPEPLLADGDAVDAATQVEIGDSLSMAFLVLLESLNPVERAVFLLREVFDYGYDEIAEIVDRTPENCRQLAVRARRSVQERRPRYEASAQRRAELAQHFFAACQQGELDALKQLLADDVTFQGDGGGKAPAVARVVTGVDKVTRLLLGLLSQGAELGLTIESVQINGEPGALTRTADGKIVSAVALEIADGRIHAIRSVVNPDKLGHLGVVADMRQLMRELRHLDG